MKLLTRLSRYFRLTEFVLAFILMTFATTLPELVVGITSGIKGVPLISLGNIIGSNLINLTLILGLVAVVSNGLKVESKIVKKDAWIMFFITLIPLLLLFDKKISRPEGFLLLIVFGWYVWHIIKSKDAFKHRVHHINNEITSSHKLLKTILYFIIAVAILILSAWGVVEIAKLIAVELYVPLVVISIILVSLGTSLPEMVFGIKAAIVKHEGISLENIIGSIVVNSGFILGLTAIISPIKMENSRPILIGGIFMLLAILLSNIFLSSGRNNFQKRRLVFNWVLSGILNCGVFI